MTDAIANLLKDLTIASDLMADTDTFPTGQAIMKDAAKTIAALQAESAALIDNAMKSYKRPNPTKSRFDMAMHAITSERNARGCADSLWKEYKQKIDDLEAENAKLREALSVIATHRAKCHEYDTDCGHEKRSFDEEDVRLMERQAKSALSGQDAEGET